MRRLFYASSIYLALGLGSGLFFREFAKAHGFSDSTFTQLAVAHTHLLTLGVIVLLIVLLLEKVFTLSASPLFGWFFWTYNAGVVLTAAMLVWHGSLTVLGMPSSAMISGIAGLGHIVLTAGFVLLFLALGKALTRDRAAGAAATAAQPEASAE